MLHFPWMLRYIVSIERQKFKWPKWSKCVEISGNVTRLWSRTHKSCSPLDSSESVIFVRLCRLSFLHHHKSAKNVSNQENNQSINNYVVTSWKTCGFSWLNFSHSNYLEISKQQNDRRTHFPIKNASDHHFFRSYLEHYSTAHSLWPEWVWTFDYFSDLLQS